MEAPLPLAGLTDLQLVRTPTGGLARPSAPDAALTAQELIEYARSVTSPGRDVRVLVDDGARNATTLGLVAEGLGCDLLITPTGTRLEVLVGAGGGKGEAVPVERVSGGVADWVLLQPPSLTTALPGWFDLAGGLVLPRSGIVTLPLAGGGLEFANRDDFVLRRAAAAALGAGHPGLITVAVTARDGQFRLSTYDQGSRGRSATGQDLAAALSSVYLYGGDLRLWLRWPDDTAEQSRLTRQLSALAEATGATVWTPHIGDEAVLLRGCRDLSARNRDGEITGWTEFRPPSWPIGEARFVTDLDGRLMPRSTPYVFRAGGVAVVSTGRQIEKWLRTRYAEVTAEHGSMLLDLTVLTDGRLAWHHEDGTDLAAGPAELHARLEAAGWSGEDLLLLTPVAFDHVASLHGHLTHLEKELGTEIWTLPPGASLGIARGLARAIDENGEPARWRRAGSPEDVTETGRWRNDDGWLIPRHRLVVTTPSSSVPSPPPQPQIEVEVVAAQSEPERVLPAPDSRPALTLPARGRRPHGVRWLPEQPEVNAVPMTLYVACDWPAERVATHGVPSANLFLAGNLDGERTARANARRHLLRLRVAAGAAVDLGRVPDVPADLRHLAAEGSVFVLPAGWLDQAQTETMYRIDEHGRPGDEKELPPHPLLLRCTGARHGTDGLPNEVVPWPRAERGSGAWAVLPLDAATPSGDHLALHTRRPEVQPGHRLVHLTIEANRAIDVTATAAGLVELAAVRSRLPELVAAGVTLLLPKRVWARTRVDEVLLADGNRWRTSARGIDLPLSSLTGDQAG
uniref:hypothetical protein n=1 Tax=Paractinoplanes polyasparticus TaxID=2856853 RepID=UPI001C8655CC|nr:hypothetical protein [Actinoplanes polyasparticus]